MPELKPPPVFASKNLVMLKTKLGRRIRNGIALRFKCGVKSTNRAVFTVVRQQSTANRAGPFVLRCRHSIRFAVSNLLDLVGNGLRKIGLPSPTRERDCALAMNPFLQSAWTRPAKVDPLTATVLGPQTNYEDLKGRSFLKFPMRQGAAPRSFERLQPFFRALSANVSFPTVLLLVKFYPGKREAL